MRDDGGEIPAALGPEHATDRDVQCMRRALELADEAARLGDTPIGAVVYRTSDGRVLAEAHNRREIDRDPTAHAETLALREAAHQLGTWRLEGCTLVVTLEPCVMCAGAIVNARVGRLVYGAADEKAGGVESLYRLCQDPRLNHRVRPIAGVLARESSERLRAFFRARRGGGGGGADEVREG
jgi:tRNA(adenine34) deaminase